MMAKKQKRSSRAWCQGRMVKRSVFHVPQHSSGPSFAQSIASLVSALFKRRSVRSRGGSRGSA